MKKKGFFLICIGIVLIVIGYNKSDFSKNNTDKKEENNNNQEVSNNYIKSVTLKNYNIDKKTLTTFNFPSELKCFVKNEFEFECNNHDGKKKEIDVSIKASTEKSSYSIYELIKNLKRTGPGYEGKTYSDIKSCKSNMKCLREDESSYYEGGKLAAITTEVTILINHDNNYYTDIDMHFYNDKGETDNSQIEKYIDDFINGIETGKYTEEEPKYKDDKLAITLTAPRFNEDNKLEIYLSKDKYRYGSTMYENTNDTFKIYTKSRVENGLHISDLITLKYIYNKNLKYLTEGELNTNVDKNKLIDEFSILGDRAVDSYTAVVKRIGNKELYHREYDNKHFLYIINERYAYSVSSTRDLTDDDLKDLFDF